MADPEPQPECLPYPKMTFDEMKQKMDAGKAIFSTDNGKRSKQVVTDLIDCPILLRDNPAADIPPMVQTLRNKCRKECLEITPSTDVFEYWDHRDIHVMGYEFLSSVLRYIAQQNAEWRMFAQIRADTFKERFPERYQELAPSADVDFFRPKEIAGEGPYMVEEMLSKLKDMKRQEDAAKPAEQLQGDRTISASRPSAVSNHGADTLRKPSDPDGDKHFQHLTKGTATSSSSSTPTTAIAPVTRECPPQSSHGCVPQPSAPGPFLPAPVPTELHQFEMSNAIMPTHAGGVVLQHPNGQFHMLRSNSDGQIHAVNQADLTFRGAGIPLHLSHQPFYHVASGQPHTTLNSPAIRPSMVYDPRWPSRIGSPQTIPMPPQSPSHHPSDDTLISPDPAGLSALNAAPQLAPMLPPTGPYPAYPGQSIQSRPGHVSQVPGSQHLQGQLLSSVPLPKHRVFSGATNAAYGQHGRGNDLNQGMRGEAFAPPDFRPLHFNPGRYNPRKVYTNDARRLSITGQSPRRPSDEHYEALARVPGPIHLTRRFSGSRGARSRTNSFQRQTPYTHPHAYQTNQKPDHAPSENAYLGYAQITPLQSGGPLKTRVELVDQDDEHTPAVPATRADDLKPLPTQGGPFTLPEKNELDSRKLYVRGYGLTEGLLDVTFGRFHGKVECVKFYNSTYHPPRNRDSRRNDDENFRIAFVSFADPDDATRALTAFSEGQMAGSAISAVRRAYVQRPRPAGYQLQQRGNESPQKSAGDRRSPQKTSEIVTDAQHPSTSRTVAPLETPKKAQRHAQGSNSAPSTPRKLTSKASVKTKRKQKLDAESSHSCRTDSPPVPLGPQHSTKVRSQKPDGHKESTSTRDMIESASATGSPTRRPRAVQTEAKEEQDGTHLETMEQTSGTFTGHRPEHQLAVQEVVIPAPYSHLTEETALDLVDRENQAPSISSAKDSSVGEGDSLNTSEELFKQSESGEASKNGSETGNSVSKARVWSASMPKDQLVIPDEKDFPTLDQAKETKQKKGSKKDRKLTLKDTNVPDNANAGSKVPKVPAENTDGSIKQGRVVNAQVSRTSGLGCSPGESIVDTKPTTEHAAETRDAAKPATSAATSRDVPAASKTAGAASENEKPGSSTRPGFDNREGSDYSKTVLKSQEYAVKENVRVEDKTSPSANRQYPSIGVGESMRLDDTSFYDEHALQIRRLQLPPTPWLPQARQQPRAEAVASLPLIAYPFAPDASEAAEAGKKPKKKKPKRKAKKKSIGGGSAASNDSEKTIVEEEEPLHIRGGDSSKAVSKYESPELARARKAYEFVQAVEQYERGKHMIDLVTGVATGQIRLKNGEEGGGQRGKNDCKWYLINGSEEQGKDAAIGFSTRKKPGDGMFRFNSSPESSPSSATSTAAQASSSVRRRRGAAWPTSRRRTGRHSRRSTPPGSSDSSALGDELDLGRDRKIPHKSPRKRGMDDPFAARPGSARARPKLQLCEELLNEPKPLKNLFLLEHPGFEAAHRGRADGPRVVEVEDEEEGVVEKADSDALSSSTGAGDEGEGSE